jgi:hypothetical protein
LYAGGICWTLVYDTIYAHQVGFDVGERTPVYDAFFRIKPTMYELASSLLRSCSVITAAPS